MPVRPSASSDFLAIFGGRAGVAATGLTSVNPWERLRPLVERMARTDARLRQMRHLASLEPHLLDDIGITRRQVLDELRRG